MRISLFIAPLFLFSCLSGKADKGPNKNPEVLGTIAKRPVTYSKEMILGNILKSALENMHLSKKKVNDELSVEAFKMYLQRLDYGKQFLLKDDVKNLSKFEKLMDDEFSEGTLKLVETSSKIMKERVGQVEKMVGELLKGPFDFKKKEFIETDPEKRKYASNLKGLKELWRKKLKYETLSRYFELEEEEKATNDVVDKDKEKSKKVADKNAKFKKKSTPKELQTLARNKVGKSYKRVFKRLKNEKQSEKTEKFYNSITRVFDPHTHFLPPAEKEDFDIDMKGKLEGIGAVLREENSYIKVERIVPGSPSYRGRQLEAEDVIIKVGQADEDPVDVTDMGLQEAVRLIRGPKGTVVKLTVKKPNGMIQIVPITRDVVQIEDGYVKSSIIKLKDSPKKVGYITIPKFYRDFDDEKGPNATDDTRKALVALKKKGVDGVILDLRNNGGGALPDARMISGLFIKKGPIVQVRDHRSRVEVLKDKDEEIVFEKPVIVLLNRFSASASEIVAAALKDYGRAVVVGGEHSHGKGTVQAVVDLDNYLSSLAKNYSPLGALKITIQKFFRINGSSTQYKGVRPDIILPDPYAYVESGERYLDYSLKWAKVAPVPYRKWPEDLNLDGLKKKSAARVKIDAKFKKIIESNLWYEKRKKQTSKSLAFSDFMLEREQIKKTSDELKIEKESPDVVVEAVSDLKSEEDKTRFEDVEKGLKTDPYIKESLYIMSDLLKSPKQAASVVKGL